MRPAAKATVAVVALAVIGCTKDVTTAPESLTALPPKLANALFTTPWVASGPFPTPVSHVDENVVTLHSDGTSSNPSMSYRLAGFSVYETRMWQLSTTAATAETMKLGFNYSGYHAFFLAKMSLDVFVTRGGVTTTTRLFNELRVSGGFNVTGSTTVTVQPGDVYGFRFGGTHGDFDRRLQGTFTAFLVTDDTPPEIDANVDGTLGDNGWYVSPVDISWDVSDDQSLVSSKTGCGPTTLSDDTEGTKLKCSATSDGGTASEEITVKIDQTAPTLNYDENEGSYSVEDFVNIACRAGDNLSGLAEVDCTPISGPAYSFGAGSHTFSGSVRDNAGNTGSASVTFTVNVTHAGLCALVQQFASNAGIARSLCAKLSNAAAAEQRGQANASAGMLGAFRNEVSAQTGKAFTDDEARILLELSNAL